MNLNACNADEALANGLWYLMTAGYNEESRGGDVMVAAVPVMTTYLCPSNRVLFSPHRDANPVFHLMEAVWMLAGERDVSWLLQFNSTFAKYAEDNGYMHGAYGYRWSKHFSYDQLADIAEVLRKDPLSRQAVLAMWDAPYDLNETYKDIPCNTHVYFDLRRGKLNMTVCCRSNDIIWGAYGSNVVHFSLLQEVLASELGVQVGVYRQFSNNYHAYKDNPFFKAVCEDRSLASFTSRYETHGVLPYPIKSSLSEIVADCTNVVHGTPQDATTPFFINVVIPLLHAHRAYKEGDKPRAIALAAGLMPDRNDWRMAFTEWVQRRMERENVG